MRIYEPATNNNRKAGTGIFTRFLQREMPWLPLEEDGRLNDPTLRENFIGRICALHEFHEMWKKGLTRHGLIAFHSQYKLLLLAHSQKNTVNWAPLLPR